MEIPEERASLSSPYTPRFHSQTPVAAAPALLGRYAAVITAAPRGNGIFICAVITAAHPQQRAQREQGKRQRGACPPSSRHTRRIMQAVSSRHSLRPALTHSHTHKHSHPPPFGVLLAIAGATAGHLALCIGSHPFLSLNLCPLPSLPAGPAAGLLSAVTQIQPSWGSSAAVWWLPDTRVSDTEIEQSSLQSHVGHQEKPWASDFALPAQPGQPPPHFHRHKIHLKRSV